MNYVGEKLIFVSFETAENVTMEPGDMVLYESHSVVSFNSETFLCL
jgi:predicted 2-oxoglutarate/Fe(II)-dependent dioxygenase YbiX